MTNIKKIKYYCDGCKKEGEGYYCRGGWWSYPPRWFIAESDEEDSMLKCFECVLIKEKK